tara:strand:+ start:1232 stop:1435 length:204 start_codon:yes stop_codon:yes gene_type:complete
MLLYRLFNKKDFKLTFSYSKNFSAAGTTGTLGCWAAIFQGYLLCTLNIDFLSAFNTICLTHKQTPQI